MAWGWRPKHAKHAITLTESSMTLISFVVSVYEYIVQILLI